MTSATRRGEIGILWHAAGRELSPAAVLTIRKDLDDPNVAKRMAESPRTMLRIVTALVLGSPEFQPR